MNGIALVVLVFALVLACVAYALQQQQQQQQEERFDSGAAAGGAAEVGEDDTELNAAGEALVRSDCVIGDYAFSEILRRNPADPGGLTCVVSGKGFGLLKDSTHCRPSPDVSGKTPAGNAYSWTNPLTDGTLGEKGVKFSSVPTLLNTGEPVCLVDFTGLGTSKNALQAIDAALSQKAAALTSGAFYSAAVIAGLQGKSASEIKAAMSSPADWSREQEDLHLKLGETKRLCDLKLTALRAASAANAACREGQPCGVSGGIVRRLATTSPSGVRNLCVDATSSNATLTPCSPSFSSRGHLWTLASTGQLVLSASSNSPTPTCLSGSADDSVKGAACDPLDARQLWTVPKKSRDERNPRLGQLVNSAASTCLDSTAADLVLKPCSSAASTQQWTFSHVGSTSLQPPQQSHKGVVGRLSTPQGQCVRAELDPEPWGIDPATGQPYEYHLVANKDEGRCAPDQRDGLFSVNDNGTLESVAFPGQCVAFDAKSWQVGWGVRLAACDRSARPADAQRFGKSIVDETSPLSTREGAEGPRACLAAEKSPDSATTARIVRTPCGTGGKSAGITFRSLSKHP